MAAGGPIFIFNTILVNGQETNGAIFVGQNNASYWATHNKNQAINAFIFGAFNAFPYNIEIINDQDVIDTTINDPDLQPGGPKVQQ